jgi:hypothetical protein
MRRKWLLLALLLLTLSSRWSSGQEFKDLTFRERLFFGGDFWISFGDVTDILLSPIAGYRITERLSAGLGVTYEYYSNRFPVKYKTHIYGGRGLASYALIKNLNNVIPIGVGISILAHGEYESLNLERQYFDVDHPDSQGRFWMNNILVGGGIGIPTGERSSATIYILWNLNENASALYTNPIVRFGFNF